MIRKLFKRLFNQQTAPNSIEKGQILPFKSHHIRRDQIDNCALSITSELQNAGYTAFIVGGAVRDLLLGIVPKDYDIATNARPEEIRSIFRRSRIIGRRFQLVHVMCGNEIVEVSTFRGHSSDPEKQITKQVDQHGRLLRDNVFGSQAEDAVRRDFTINALFYDPEREEIHDFVGGYQDIKHKKLRIIGLPEQRYREDPVRMLRAIRFAAKLEMQIDQNTAKPISDLAPLLQNVPPARVFDEMMKLLLSGYALSCVIDLRARGLHHGLLPFLDVILEQPMGEQFITHALKCTDTRIKQGKAVSPGFIFAVLLWHEVLIAWNRYKKSGEKPLPALFQAMDEILTIQRKKLAIPRRFDAIIQEIWAMQPRFQARTGHKPFRLLSHPRFRAAYDFMLLRCESGELDMAIGTWWKDFQDASQSEREKMLTETTRSPKRKRSRAKKQPIDANRIMTTSV